MTFSHRHQYQVRCKNPFEKSTVFSKQFSFYLFSFTSMSSKCLIRCSRPWTVWTTLCSQGQWGRRASLRSHFLPLCWLPAKGDSCVAHEVYNFRRDSIVTCLSVLGIFIIWGLDIGMCCFFGFFFGGGDDLTTKLIFTRYLKTVPVGLPCNLGKAVTAGHVKRRPAVLVPLIDISAVLEQQLHRLHVSCQHGFV